VSQKRSLSGKNAPLRVRFATVPTSNEPGEQKNPLEVALFSWSVRVNGCGLFFASLIAVRRSKV